MKPTLGAFASLIVTGALGAAVGGCDRDVAGGEALFKDLASADYRNSYARPPGWARRLRGESPHGTWVDVYINTVMAEAIDDNVPLDAWPVGSRVVLEGWITEDAESREFLVVMSKPTATDFWYWAEWDSEDALVYAGDAVDNCVKCHEAGEDEARAFVLPPISKP